MTNDISVSALTKKYGEIEAVRGIDFEVAAGESLIDARCNARISRLGTGSAT